MRMRRATYQAQGFTATQVEGFFMVSKKASETSIINRLTGSQYRLWHYLMIFQPFADQTDNGERIYRDIPSPAEIGIAIGSSPRTVEKDMNRLEKLGLYARRISRWQGYNLTAEEAHNASEAMKQAKAERLNNPPAKQPPSLGAENECNNKTNLKPLDSKGGYLAANSVKQPPERLNNRESGKITEDKIAETQTVQASPVPAILPQTKQTDQTTHTAALANATPAPLPDVCVFLVEEEEEEQEAASQVAEIEEEQSPGRVEQLIKNFAQKKSLNQGTNSAAAEKPRKNRSATIEWNCPGSPEEKLEFLAWKADLLVKAGKSTKLEARGYALSWAKKNAEEATLIFEDWRKERNQHLTPVSSSGPVVKTVANFENRSKSWHAKLITTYRQEGEEAFLAREGWHKDWLQHVKTYRPRLLEGC